MVDAWCKLGAGGTTAANKSYPCFFFVCTEVIGNWYDGIMWPAEAWPQLKGPASLACRAQRGKPRCKHEQIRFIVYELLHSLFQGRAAWKLGQTHPMPSVSQDKEELVQARHVQAHEAHTSRFFLSGAQKSESHINACEGTCRAFLLAVAHNFCLLPSKMQEFGWKIAVKMHALQVWNKFCSMPRDDVQGPYLALALPRC